MVVFMESIFCRTEKLIGREALEKLNNSTVAVFGLGGVGSYVVEGLARGGVGHLILVDSDTVSSSNINRQLIALTDTVGKFKTEVMMERIKAINSLAEVQIINDFYLPDKADIFFLSQYDYMVDAVDTVTAKIDLVVQAKKRKIPIISCMGTGNKIDPTAFEISDIKQTSVCPLARVMRRELRARGIDELKVVYSREKPVCAADGNTTERTPGSISFVPSVAGLIIAGEVIKGLIGEIKQ